MCISNLQLPLQSGGEGSLFIFPAIICSVFCCPVLMTAISDKNSLIFHFWTNPGCSPASFPCTGQGLVMSYMNESGSFLENFRDEIFADHMTCKAVTCCGGWVWGVTDSLSHKSDLQTYSRMPVGQDGRIASAKLCSGSCFDFFIFFYTLLEFRQTRWLTLNSRLTIAPFPEEEVLAASKRAFSPVDLCRINKT